VAEFILINEGILLNKKISIDSNSLTYLLEAISIGYDPQNDNSSLRSERLAMIRIFLYRDMGFFYVLPSVKKEYLKITDNQWRKEHENLVQILLKNYPFTLDKNNLHKRIRELLLYHNSTKDCTILAEAEQSNMDILLTRDIDFIKRLSPYANNVNIVKASDYFKTLNIKPGSQPKLRPSESNPLSKKNWWRV
jgi:hypothetical protein